MIRQHVSMALVAAAVAGSVVFVAMYHRRARWWRSESGWWLMTLGVGDGLWMSMALIGGLLRVTAEWFLWAMVAAYATVPVTVWWRCRLFLVAQRHADDEERDAREQDP